MSGKKYKQAREKVEQERYALDEAVRLMQEVKFVQFDETAEIALRLGVKFLNSFFGSHPMFPCRNLRAKGKLA